MYDNLFTILQILTYAFVFVVGTGVLIVIFLFIRDITQTENAIRRNFPVIGRFRPLFEKLGEFFRQYFFALDREEMPFNRADRNWVDAAAPAQDKGNTVAFGSTRDMRAPGAIIFVNCPFPTLEVDASTPQPLIFGPYCRHPHIASSFFNISAMSYGSISKPAVQALSRGAKMAGCWLNTGEGGVC